ncbi:MAG: ABC transporter permease subunit, partial [Candidatus Thermoplasmatota archaeon]|nr:ABC transporter permease subunit [Candidatus Thermoplasmatota archaeon]
MLRINPGLVLFSCFSLALYLMIGSVEDWGRLSNGLGNLRIFFFESLWPPDWSIFEPRLYPDCQAPGGLSITCSTAWIGMIETLKIAFISTVFGMVISLPLSLLAANNISSPGLSVATRFILASMRSLPSIIWAIFFVILIGFGPISGIFAMTVYTVGYLGKLQYEAIEGMSSLPLEAAEAAGLGRIEKTINIVIPESANDLI